MLPPGRSDSDPSPKLPSRISQEVGLGKKRHDLLDRCVAQAWDSLHPEIRRWIPEDRLLAHLSASTADELGRVGDAAFAAGFREAMPVPGATQADYGPKILDIAEHGTLVAGIRFRADPPFSFVEVYARDYPFKNARTITTTLECVGRIFAVFSPRYLRVHVAAASTEQQVVESFPGRTDFLTVAGLLAALQGRSRPPRMERVHLEPATSTDFYDRYLAEYEAFHEASPHLQDLVPVASHDALERSRAQGLLYHAYVDGAWAGVIAGREQTELGMRGYRIVEEVLSSRFRGLGFGPALQRHFIDSLPAEDCQVLHGAIDPSNVPSLATAKRVGRIEVMTTRLIAS